MSRPFCCELATFVRKKGKIMKWNIILINSYSPYCILRDGTPYNGVPLLPAEEPLVSYFRRESRIRSGRRTRDDRAVGSGPSSCPEFGRRAAGHAVRPRAAPPRSLGEGTTWKSCSFARPGCDLRHDLNFIPLGVQPLAWEARARSAATASQGKTFPAGGAPHGGVCVWESGVDA